MSDLIVAAQTAIEQSDQLKKQISQLQQELAIATHQRNILQGQLSESQRLYDQARADSDHNLRWSTEVTRQLYNVGNFVNEAIELAREEMKKAGVPTFGNNLTADYTEGNHIQPHDLTTQQQRSDGNGH